MKFILYTILSLVVLIIISVIALTQFVNPNQFKPLIIQQVEKSTGQTLVINGDLHWHFLPSLGLTVNDIALQNPVGFNAPNLLTVTKAQLSVEIMPLLSRKLVLGNIAIDQPNIDIETNVLGQSNLDFLNKNDSTSNSTMSENTTTSPKITDNSSKWSVSIAGVSLNQAKITINNAQTEQSTQLTQVDLKLSQWVDGQWADLTFGLQGTHQDTQFLFDGSAQIKAASNITNLELKNVAVMANVSGKDWSIKQAKITLADWLKGQWANVTYEVKGQAKGNDFSFNGQGQAQWNSIQSLALIKNFTLNGDLSGENIPDGRLPITATLTGRYNTKEALLAFNAIQATIQDTKLSGNINARLNDIPSLNFDFSMPALNVDKWQTWWSAFSKDERAPLTTNKRNVPDSTTEVTSVEGDTVGDVEPNLLALKTINLQGKLKIGALTLAKATLSNVALKTQLKDGVLNIQKLNADLYQGQLSFVGQLNAQSPIATYQANATLDQVQIAPLLFAITQKDWVSGTADVRFTASGNGLSSLALRQNGEGNLTLNLSNGQLYGLNLSEMIRDGKAALKGEAMTDTKTEKSTDFSQANMTLNWKNGVASTQSLQLTSPLAVLSGQAQSDLVEQTLQGNFNATLSQKTAQVGDDLAGLVIPVSLYGTWDAPNWKIDVKSLLLNNNSLKQKAEREIDRGLNKVFGNDSKNQKTKEAVSDLLKGFFN